MLTHLSSLLLLSTLAYALDAAQYRQHETRKESHAWSKRGKPHSKMFIPVKIGLTQQNLQQGEELLYKISNPASKDYGRHLTPEEIIHLFRPTPETHEAVHSWLTGAGIDANRIQTSVNHWMTFNATLSEVEKLLQTEYHIFEHDKTGSKHVACDSYSIPTHLFKHIEMVTPTVHFDKPISNAAKRPVSGPITGPETAPFSKPPTKKGPVSNNPSGYSPSAVQSMIANSMSVCYYETLPSCLRMLYSIPINYHSNPTNSFAMVEYAPNNYNTSDLTMFNGVFSPRQVGSFPILDSVDGGSLSVSSTNNEVEPSLDFEIANLVWPQQSTLLQAGTNNYGVSFGNLLDAIDASYCSYDGGDNPNYDAQFPSGSASCGTYSPPNVLATSYGYDEGGLGEAYEARQCYEYMKLGLVGTTVVFSAGDYGVAGEGGACSTTNGISPFVPSFPSTCPYVTSVGSTQVQASQNIADGSQSQYEMSTSAFASGGGFSNYFSMPSYQTAAVGNYLQNYPPPYNSSQYSNSGDVRAYPDIAAAGYDYVIAFDNGFYYVDGTSASAPTVASVFTLLNQERLNAGKSPIGFVNPALYANPSVLNDITVGANPGCNTNGFSTAPGWDPVSGLGTPDYPAMLAYFLSLP